jgi:hypothetical protein
MSEKRKKKDKLCERRTISFDADLYALALQRMKEEGETMFSRYVQALVRKDTAELRAKFINKVDEFPLSKVAEDPTPYGSPAANATVPLARRSSTSYTPRKAK